MSYSEGSGDCIFKDPRLTAVYSSIPKVSNLAGGCKGDMTNAAPFCRFEINSAPIPNFLPTAQARGVLTKVNGVCGTVCQAHLVCQSCGTRTSNAIVIEILVMVLPALSAANQWMKLSEVILQVACPSCATDYATNLQNVTSEDHL
jgi:hypothetical protein